MKGIAVCNRNHDTATENHMVYSVTCHPAAVTLPSRNWYSVLDLTTSEGCLAELTWSVVISIPNIVYRRKTVTYLRNNQAVSWLGIVGTRCRKSQVRCPNH